MNVHNMTQIVVLDSKDERYALSTATILKKQLAQFGYKPAIHSDIEPPKPSEGRVLQRSYRDSLVWANKRLSELQLDESHDVHIILGYLAHEMASLGSLIETPEERRGYYLWLDAINHQMLELPRPTATYFLSFDKKAASEVTYTEIERLFPKDYTILDCRRSNGLLSPDQTASLISTRLEALLQPSNKKESVVQDEPENDTLQAAFIQGLSAAEQHLARLVEPVVLDKLPAQPAEGQHRTDNTVCRLIEAFPKNELLLADIARYTNEASPLHLQTPRPYIERSEELKSVIKNNDSVIDLYKYILELRLPYYLIDGLPTKNVKCCAPTVRHGYLFPEEILQNEKLSSAYEACYDAAHDIFNNAQHRNEVPQGGILGGHFVYVLATFTLLQLKELLVSSEFAMYRADIIETISLQHPLTMSSVV